MGRQCIWGLAVAAALSPASADAQTMARPSDEAIPRATEVVFATEEAAEDARGRAPNWLERAVDEQVLRLASSAAFAEFARPARQQPEGQKRSWIGRHPVLFGALAGFGGGFLIGYVPGRDGTCPDSDASACGWLLGGVGAGAGAAMGAVVAALAK